MKFSNATASPSTNAMFGIETPTGRTPFQGASLDGTSLRAKDLGYSVRPPRGHRIMSKLQDQHVGRKIRPSGNHEITRAKPLVSEQRKLSLPRQFPDLITSDSPAARMPFFGGFGP